MDETGIREDIRKQYQSFLNEKVADINGLIGNKRTFNVQAIDDNYKGGVEACENCLKESSKYYIKEFKDDMVFGNEKWSTKDRFLKQKQMLYSLVKSYDVDLIASTHQLDISYRKSDVQDRVYLEMGNFKKHEDEFVKEQAYAHARKFAKANPALLVLGVMLILVGAIFLIIGLMPQRGKGYTYSTLPYLVAGTLMYIAGIPFIPIGIATMSRRKREKRRKKIARRLEASIRECIKDITVTYTQQFEETVAKPMLKIENSLLVTFDKWDKAFAVAKDNAESYRYSHYAFANDLDENEVRDIYQIMNQGLANSYSEAVKYYREQKRQEAKDAAEAEARRKLIENSNIQVESQLRVEEYNRDMANQVRLQTQISRDAYYEQRRANEAALQEQRNANARAKKDREKALKEQNRHNYYVEDKIK